MIDLPSRYTPSGVSEKGGFGEVFFCEDKHLNRPVAIKYIQNIIQKKRIYDELNALLQMRSNHVVQVYDIIPCENDSIGIVEEFVKGEDLFDSEFAKQSSHNYLKTLWQIASGIADIHEAGIIHRDIKPSNMKLDGEGVIKIFDFGLARPVGVEAATKGFKGTRLFAAPELYSVDTVAFTRAIDTYAFGATALILATDSVPESLGEIPPEEAPKGFFSELPIEIPDEISEILESCLSYKPDDRPPMDYVRDEIARYLLHNKHQALAIINGESSYLNSEKKKVRLEFSDVGTVSISYTGLRFIVTEVSGEVYLNNAPVIINQELPGSCVVSLGGAHRSSSQRTFITFDVSHPEVVI